MRNAFTMIELVFVIIVIGILSAIVIPKFTATREDAQISKGRADISSIRSAIITERQSRLITGDSSFITGLKINGTKLFDGVLTYGITDNASAGHWTSIGTDSVASAHYRYKIGNSNCNFTYTSSDGTLVLDVAQAAICSKLVE